MYLRLFRGKGMTRFSQIIRREIRSAEGATCIYSVRPKQFAIGLACGMLLGIVFATYMSVWSRLESERNVPVQWSTVWRGNSTWTQGNQQVGFEDTRAHQDDYEIAAALEKKVRILCWIMTCPRNLERKAKHVRSTWGVRCNKLIFVSSVTNNTFPTIGFNTSKGHKHDTEKTMHAFRYIYENYLDEADWFMKADDGTYVIMENLRYFLSAENTNTPVYFVQYKRNSLFGYYTGEAGYVLSKDALRRIACHGKILCRRRGKFARCMENVGVMLGNSTDRLGRRRFHDFVPDRYHNYKAHHWKQVIASFSDYAISFHNVLPKKMYALEFHTYHLRPYGIRQELQDLNHGS